MGISYLKHFQFYSYPLVCLTGTAEASFQFGLKTSDVTCCAEASECVSSNPESFLWSAYQGFYHFRPMTSLKTPEAETQLRIFCSWIKTFPHLSFSYNYTSTFTALSPVKPLPHICNNICLFYTLWPIGGFLCIWSPDEASWSEPFCKTISWGASMLHETASRHHY